MENSKILIVAMHETFEHCNLNVSDETAVIQRHVESSASIEVLTTSTTAVVLQQITVCSMIHFACHDFSDAEQPSKSALLLETGSIETLTVDDFQPLNHQLAQVAYLSACSTAKIDAQSLIDESIHLASTFQLVGFRHVIETM